MNSAKLTLPRRTTSATIAFTTASLAPPSVRRDAGRPFQCAARRIIGWAG